MGSNPLNLALRFVLELAALAGMGMWGWQQGHGVVRYAVAFGVPVIAASLWATFAVPGDPSRSGNAPVPIAGVLRLGIEAAFFGVGVWTLHAVGMPVFSVVLATAILAHYAASYDRIAWLLNADARADKSLERTHEK